MSPLAMTLAQIVAGFVLAAVGIGITWLAYWLISVDLRVWNRQRRQRARRYRERQRHAALLRSLNE